MKFNRAVELLKEHGFVYDFQRQQWVRQTIQVVPETLLRADASATLANIGIFETRKTDYTAVYPHLRDLYWLFRVEHGRLADSDTEAIKWYEKKTGKKLGHIF